LSDVLWGVRRVVWGPGSRGFGGAGREVEGWFVRSSMRVLEGVRDGEQSGGQEGFGGSQGWGAVRGSGG